MEPQYVLSLFRELEGNKSAVARRLGISRRTVGRILDGIPSEARKRPVKAVKAAMPIQHRGSREEAAKALYEWLRPNLNKTFPQGEACAVLNRGLPYLKQVVAELQDTGYNVYFDYGQIGLMTEGTGFARSTTPRMRSFGSERSRTHISDRRRNGSTCFTTCMTGSSAKR
jgi:hypothetical protein